MGLVLLGIGFALGLGAYRNIPPAMVPMPIVVLWIYVASIALAWFVSRNHSQSQMQLQIQEQNQEQDQKQAQQQLLEVNIYKDGTVEGRVASRSEVAAPTALPLPTPAAQLTEGQRRLFDVPEAEPSLGLDTFDGVSVTDLAGRREDPDELVRRAVTEANRDNSVTTDHGS